MPMYGDRLELDDVPMLGFFGNFKGLSRDKIHMKSNDFSLVRFFRSLISFSRTICVLYPCLMPTLEARNFP